MRYLMLIGAAALAACASGEEANLSSIEGNADQTAQALADDVTGGGANNAASQPAPGSPSQWFERTSEGEQWAGYGPPFSEAVFSVRCERGGGRLIFTTTEIPRSGPGSTTMQLSAAGVDESLAAEASEEGLPNTEASVSADADWLNRLESASGDLRVRVGGGDPLVIPTSDQLRSVVRDCGPEKTA